MISFFKVIINIFKWNLKLLSFLRKIFLNVILIALLIVFVKIWFQYKYFNNFNKYSYKALNINIQGFIVDNFKSDVVSSSYINYLTSFKNFNRQGNSVFDIVEKIRAAEKDKYITGIVLDLTELQGGDFTLLEYIGKALQEFKSSGKKIYSIGNNYNQIQYYLSSFANEIYLHPYGSVNLEGFSNQEFFFQKLLKKLKVESEIFRQGKYKSSVEPFFRNNMSKESKLVKNQLINEKWNYYLNEIAKNRKTFPKIIFPDMKKMIQDLKLVNGNLSVFAKNHKLIDKILSQEQLKNELIKKFGLNQAKNDFNQISIYDYFINSHKQTETKNSIAVILLNGIITQANEFTTNNNIINSNFAKNQIQHVIDNPNIKAIVLRINSPGGEVLASEIIREKLEEVKKIGKPVIISMGETAASGAYWIASAGNYIIANPMTLTGSIGIFGVFHNINNSLKYIGINVDQINTSPLFNNVLVGKISKELKKITELNITYEYQQFIKTIALSRKKSTLEIQKIAKGRVWNGIHAKIHGLIDNTGDFDDAIKKAAELSNIKNYNILWIGKENYFIDIKNNYFLFNNHSYSLNVLKNILISSNNLQFVNYNLLLNLFKKNYIHNLLAIKL